ncbi:hypothetical protein Acsp02_93510 [Actinoplanes sp. NBRC 103695]|nr:hypothetical protein Acsp02_93510 [Actinoplanes sp. NBRC 103695]
MTAVYTSTVLRKTALDHGMPQDVVVYWVSLAGPCIALDTDGLGPVVGHFGGHPLLPASVAGPAHHAHLVTIDLAAIGKFTTDLDPSRGWHTGVLRGAGARLGRGTGRLRAGR